MHTNAAKFVAAAGILREGWSFQAGAGGISLAFTLFVRDLMREQGVRVGRLFPAMPEHLRVTIGTPEEMQRFLEAFKTIAD